MKAALKIEAIDDNTYKYFSFWTGLLNDGSPGLGDLMGLPKRNYWVAQIIGTDAQFAYNRQFIKPRKDYRKSNRPGSRGVYLWYTLESSKVYEVKRPVSRQRFERFFCTVTETGEIKQITKDEVDEWLKTILE